MTRADLVGPITFEPSQGYVPGDINGQKGWTKLGPYDVQVASLATFPAASGYGFGSQACDCRTRSQAEASATRRSRRAC